MSHPIPRAWAGGEANPVGHVFVDGFWKRIGALKHHADALSRLKVGAFVVIVRSPLVIFPS